MLTARLESSALLDAAAAGLNLAVESVSPVDTDLLLGNASVGRRATEEEKAAKKEKKMQREGGVAALSRSRWA